jgi:hypothetical protein
VVSGREVVTEKIGEKEWAEKPLPVASPGAVPEVWEAERLVDAGPLVNWFPGRLVVARSDCGAGQGGARPIEGVGLGERVLTGEAEMRLEPGAGELALGEALAAWRGESVVVLANLPEAARGDGISKWRTSMCADSVIRGSWCTTLARRRSSCSRGRGPQRRQRKSRRTQRKALMAALLTTSLSVILKGK